MEPAASSLRGAVGEDKLWPVLIWNASFQMSHACGLSKSLDPHETQVRPVLLIEIKIRNIDDSRIFQLINPCKKPHDEQIPQARRKRGMTKA